MSILVELPLELYDPRAFDDFHPAGDFHRGTARAMAWMSQLAYETEHPEKIAALCSTWKLSNPVIIATPPPPGLPVAHTRGVMVEGAGATILAFAGSDPLVPTNWFNNFDIKLTGASELSAGNVHRGFTVAARSVWDQVQAGLAVRRSQPVILTGHSLGGALAVVTADLMLVDHNLRAACIYAFGMPRVGDEGFAQRYNDTLGTTTYRVVNGDDVVTTVPPSRLGFRHVGRLLRCARGAKIAADATPRSGFSDDPQFASSLASGLQQGLVDLFALRLQPSFRNDLLGRMSGLLAPPIADHLPDRYCHALDAID
jgi:hypothetical protein